MHMNGTTLPRVFIGSSKESLPIVSVIEKSLDGIATVVKWSDGDIWKAGFFTLENLISSAREFDFAVMIFGNDDKVVSRGKKNFAPRDNVVFELGLFMAHIDRHRALLAITDGVKILSDLAGLNSAHFKSRPRRKDESDAGYAKRIEHDLAGVIKVLHENIAERGPRPPVDPAPRSGPQEVQDVGRALEDILKNRRGRETTVRNFALDMASTWEMVRNRILSAESSAQKITWRSLMVNPSGPVMKKMSSPSVSKKVAGDRIKEMRAFCEDEERNYRKRKVLFECRVHDEIPMTHGFLIDKDILLLSQCNVEGGKLEAASTPYWHFENNSTHKQTRHLFKTYLNWFEHHWARGGKVWPA